MRGGNQDGYIAALAGSNNGLSHCRPYDCQSYFVGYIAALAGSNNGLSHCRPYDCQSYFVAYVGANSSLRYDCRRSSRRNSIHTCRHIVASPALRPHYTPG